MPCFGCTFRRDVMFITEPLAGVWKETEYYDPNVFIKWSEICKCSVYMDITYSVLGLFVLISHESLSLSFRDCGGVPSHIVQEKVILQYMTKLLFIVRYNKKKTYQVLSAHNHWGLTDHLVIQLFLCCPPCSYSVLCYNGEWCCASKMCVLMAWACSGNNCFCALQQRVALRFEYLPIRKVLGLPGLS